MLEKRSAILDIEASGLGLYSYPIEVGVAMLDSNVTWSALIRPESAWHDDEWDEIAADVHGLTLQDLHDHGRPADQVARELWLNLIDCVVYTDAPFEDGRWLERLRQCTWPSPPQITLHHVADLLPLDLGRLLRAGDLVPNRPHRAEAHAVVLRDLVRGSALKESC